MQKNKVEIVVEVDSATGEAHIKGLSKAMDKAGREGKKAFTGAGKAVDNMVPGLHRIIGLAGAVGTAFASWKLADSFISASAAAENYEVRLTALLGSQEKGNQLFAEMSEYAATVPFEYKEIMGAATALAGVMKGGVAEIKQWMPLIGDLAAVSGLSIEETTSQVIRMYSAGAAAADMFRERGILSMLGFKAGVSYSVAATRQQMMAEWQKMGSQFHGASLKLASTWDGLMSMMSDQWFLFRNNFMQDSGMFDYMKAGITVLLDDIKSARDESDGWAKGIGDSFTREFKRAALGAAGFMDVAEPIFTDIGSAVDSLVEKIKQNPDIAEYGLIGFALAGRKGLAVGAIAAHFKQWAEDLGTGIGMVSEGNLSAGDLATMNFDELHRTVTAENARLDKLLGGGQSQPGKGGGKTTTWTARVNGFFADTEQAYKNMRRQDTKGGRGGKSSSTIPEITPSHLKQAHLATEAEWQTQADAALAKHNALLREGEHLYKSTRTPLEKYNATIAEYKNLLAAGAIDQVTYNRAVAAAGVELDKLTKKSDTATNDMKTAFSGWANSFTDELNNALWSADNTFGNIALSFGKMLTKMTIQKKIAEPFLNAMSSGGAFKWLASIFHEGGVVGGAAPARAVSPAVFTGAPRFHSGLLPDEFPAILQRGETVIPRGGFPQSSAPQTVSVQIHNDGADKKAADTQVHFDARGFVVDVFLQDMDANGPIKQAMAGGAL